MSERPQLYVQRHERLPAGLSYPLGAQALSSALADVPQFSALELTFSARPTLFSSTHRAQLVGSADVTVARVSYTNQAPGISGGRRVPAESALYGEHWRLTIFPVPRAKRAAAAAALQVAGMPLLRRWLIAPRSSTWNTGRHLFEIAYSLATGTVSEREFSGAHAFQALSAERG